MVTNPQMPDQMILSNMRRDQEPVVVKLPAFKTVHVSVTIKLPAFEIVYVELFSQVSDVAHGPLVLDLESP